MTSWMLVIVLGTGKEVPVLCSVLRPTDEVVAAVQEVAQQHGIPADLAGAPTKGGRPARRGLYHDPGDQAGLRYWDGGQWSPLLPPEIVRPRPETVQQSPASWSGLPTADGSWTYAVTRAARLRVWAAVFAVVSAALVAGGVMDELYGHVRKDSNPGVLIFPAAAVFAVWALRAFWSRRFHLKLDKAAKRGFQAIVKNP
ncbi:MAG TPA: DUF2510 domain-containing protein [Streptosporangiaceae bacterium]